jgi:hypothetical protein
VTRTRTALAALVLLAALAGCGSEDDAGAPTTTTSTAPPATISGEGTAPGEGPVATVFTGQDSDELCALAAELDLANAFRGLGAGGDLEEAFERVVEGMDEMAAVAPPEIADDLAAASEAWDDLRGPLEAADWNVMRLEPGALEGSAEADAASARFDSYLVEVCDLSPTRG